MKHRHYRRTLSDSISELKTLNSDSNYFTKSESLTKEELVHYSNNPNLQVLDPNKMGTSGIGGLQYKRGVPENKSTFYYSSNSQPEEMVTRAAKHKYTVTLPPEHKIYDYGSDPENLVQEAKKINNGAWNEDLFHGLVKDKGYHGVRWKMNDNTEVVQHYYPLTPHKVESIYKSESPYQVHFKNSYKDGASFVDKTPSAIPTLFSENLMNTSAYVTKDGVIVGHTQVSSSDKGYHPIETKVHKDHQRKGLASLMYNTIENQTGKKIIPSTNQTPEAKALWANPNRSFGKSESLFKSPVETGSVNFGLRHILGYANQDIAQNGATIKTKSLGILPNAQRDVFGNIEQSPLNGKEVFHHVVSTPDGKSNFHFLSSHPNLNEEFPVAGIHVEHYDKSKPPSVNLSSTGISGFGFGKKLYHEAIKHHGSLASSGMTSQSANKTWQNLINQPDVKGSLGETGNTDSRHVAYYNPQKLASSEPLFKSPPLSYDEAQLAESWSEHPHRDKREELHSTMMHPSHKNDRIEMIKSLSKDAKVKKIKDHWHVQLYRGVGAGEHPEDYKIEAKSYTYDPKIAKKFSEEYAGNVVKQWIPLQHISYSFNHAHDVGGFKNTANPHEGEVIVGPLHNYKKNLKKNEELQKSNNYVTGKPITINYLRNKQKAGNFGTRHGQHIEPHGEYMIEGVNPHIENYERGSISFKNPLVVPLEPEGFPMDHTKNSWGWKSYLSQKHGKKGKDLSAHLLGLGHDGIITTDKYGSSEIVNLGGVKSGKVVKSEVTDREFEVLKKFKKDSICTMFMFEGVDHPDVLHVTHKYFSDSLTSSGKKKVLGILKDYFSKAPFKEINIIFDKVEYFGENDDVKVLRPESSKPFFVDLKNSFDEIVPDKYKEYKPHVTVNNNMNIVDYPITDFVLVDSGEIVWRASDLNKSEPLLKPYSSEAQRRWAHTKAGKEALGGEVAVAHWDAESKGKDLPEKLDKGTESADKETELIKENKMKPEAKVRHKFNAAKWTHPNGHPRCFTCGQEERIGGYCEPLEKSEKSNLMQAKLLLESPKEIEHLDIPENVVIQWSLPQKKWSK